MQDDDSIFVDFSKEKGWFGLVVSHNVHIEKENVKVQVCERNKNLV
jgi:hypothetical protein